MTIVKLVSDTTCDLPSKIVKDLDMEIVPLKVIMDGEEFTAGQELTSEEFYILLPTLNEIPTTSQPSPKKFFQVYTEIPDNYDLIISLHISRKMSGTLNSAEKAKKMLPSKPIEIFDSKNTGAALGLLLLEINERIKELETKNEIITQVDELIPQIKTIGYAGTLKYLIKGGRIGKAKGLIGKLLGTLPILKIENGEVDSV
ncbi:MAG: DegV family protein, partial [Asgard group archaeon]|nr:DegV family protein [Asgard group archaeon]